MSASALFNIELSLPKRFQLSFDRFLELGTIFTVLHLLITISPSAAGGLFGPNFWQTLTFLFIGVCAYHLVLSKIVRFTFSGEAETEGDGNVIKSIREWIKNKL
jgi:hypothetical protein